MKESKTKTVWLKEDWNDYPSGSCLHVEKETKKYYHGTCSVMCGSFYGKFPKEKCTKTNPLEYINKIVKKANKHKSKEYIVLTKLFNEGK